MCAIWLLSKPVVIGQFGFFKITSGTLLPNFELVRWLVGFICFGFFVDFSFFEAIMIHKEIRENMKGGVEPLMLQLQQGTTWLLQVGMPLPKSHG